MNILAAWIRRERQLVLKAWMAQLDEPALRHVRSLRIA